MFILFLISVDLDDCTIALWLLSHLSDMTNQEPQSLLSGHSGGVTCLAFSPDGGQLLSGGKDQVLCDINNPYMIFLVFVLIQNENVSLVKMHLSSKALVVSHTSEILSVLEFIIQDMMLQGCGRS